MSSSSALALEDLESALRQVVQKVGSPGWEDARRVFYPPARERRPLVAVCPRSSEELAAVLRWASKTGTRLTLRSGGHSFDGFCVQQNLTLVDLRGLDRITLREDGRVEVMTGVSAQRVIQALAPRGWALPLGDCPSVGMGGLISGGGFGYMSRKLGLTCDSVVEALIALPSGELVRASSRQHSELFWAALGGAGAAGVVAQWVLTSQPIPRVTVFRIACAWRAATALLDAYGAVLEASPDELDLKLKIRTTGIERFVDRTVAGPSGAVAGEPLVELDGQYLGRAGEARDLLAPFLEISGTTLLELEELPFSDASTRLVPLELVTDAAPPNLRPTRVASDFTTRRLTLPDIRALTQFIEALQYLPDQRGGAVLIEPADGATSRVAADHTAFVHRQARLLIEWELFGDDVAPESPPTRTRQDALLEEARNQMAPSLSGGRYVNYADVLDTPDQWWLHARARLERLSNQVDPHGTVHSRLRAGVKSEAGPVV